MTGIGNKFTSLYFSAKYPYVRIANRSSSLVVGDGMVHATNLLTLDNVLLVPNFSIRLLSIN